MEAPPKEEKAKMMPSSGLVKIAISQLQQLFWGIKGLKSK